MAVIVVHERGAIGLRCTWYTHTKVYIADSLCLCWSIKMIFAKNARFCIRVNQPLWTIEFSVGDSHIFLWLRETMTSHKHMKIERSMWKKSCTYKVSCTWSGSKVLGIRYNSTFSTTAGKGTSEDKMIFGWGKKKKEFDMLSLYGTVDGNTQSERHRWNEVRKRADADKNRVNHMSKPSYQSNSNQKKSSRMFKQHKSQPQQFYQV